MITILHGDNQISSRDELVSIKQAARLRGDEIVEFSTTPTITDIVQALESPSMFASSRLVIMENFIGSLRPGANRDTIIDYLCKGAFDARLVLWEGKSVGRSIIKLKRQKHITVKEHALPSTIFSFVDSIMPGNTTMALKTLRTALETTVPEVIFSMIVRQFRILIALVTNATIPETTRLAPWQKGKISRQVNSFTKEQLVRAYKELLLIDYQVKTGRTSVDLTTRIEQFMMNL